MHKYNSTDVEQYFPTYNFLNDENRDIVLSEYAAANNNLLNEEKVFTTSSNIALLALSIFGSILIGSDRDTISTIRSLSENFSYNFIFLTANLFLAVLFLVYFAQKQKEICFASRKVVLLRRLLGVSYGHTHMILPTWRIEAADEPFSIRPFKDWCDYLHFPMYLICFISSSIFLFLNHGKLSEDYNILVTLACFIFLLYLYRQSLYDYHENIFLIIAKGFSKILKFNLVNNFEYIIYRAKLQTFEIYRMEVSVHNLISALIFLEDRKFFQHKGISFKGILRASRDYIKHGRISGGSTITQQLARTLFITEFEKKLDVNL